MANTQIKHDEFRTIDEWVQDAQSQGGPIDLYAGKRREPVGAVLGSQPGARSELDAPAGTHPYVIARATLGREARIQVQTAARFDPQVGEAQVRGDLAPE